VTRALGASIVVAALATARFEAARLRAARIAILITTARIAGTLRIPALRRGILRWRQIAPTRSPLMSTTATPSTAPSPAPTTATVPAVAAAITTSIAAEILPTIIAFAAAIIPWRIFLRGIVLMAEVLRRRGVRFRLAFFEFRLSLFIARFGVGASLSMNFFVLRFLRFGRNILAMSIVVMLLARSFGDFVRRALTVSFVSSFIAPVSVRQHFARQRFDVSARRRNRRCLRVRLAGRVPVIVILEIFENVANVKESVAIQADVNESGLHSGEDAGDAALVDAAYERELFLTLDIDFD
jgi:hypothetical protein